MRLTNAILLGGAAAALAACAGSEPAPAAWQANAHLALKNFESAYLLGNTRVADAEFERARSEVSSTGRAALVARVELARCATQAASLEFNDCPGFVARAGDAEPQDRAYAAYISGRWEGLDPNLLPAQHRPVVADGALPAEPLARLVAAGALMRAQKIAPAGIASAIETASVNGWRRPLIAWLGVDEKRASMAGDNEAAARIRRRIELVVKGGK